MVTDEQSNVPAGSAPAPEVRKPDRKRLLVVLAIVVVGTAVFFLANREDAKPAATNDGTEMATIRDRDAGFSIDLPENWQFYEQQRRDPQIRMVAGDGSTQNNVRVRVSPLAQPVIIDSTTPDSILAEFQAQFDNYINDGGNVREILQRQRVNINGVQGWWYLYSFNSTAGAEEGIHSHFFLLGGEKLYVLVFQAVPSSNYEKYARTFDEIITSFKLIDPSASPEPSASPAG